MSANTLPRREELTGDDFFQDPYPYYKRMRASAAPFWLSHRQNTSSEGVLLFSRYREAQEIFSAAQGISKNLRSVRKPGAGSAFDTHMLHRDGADHLRLRRLVSEWFSAHAIAQRRPAMRELAHALLLPLIHKHEFDFVADFAELLPQQVIARLVGIPLEDMARVRTWSLLLGAGFDSLMADSEVLARQEQALAEFLDYVEELIATQREQPASSLLGFLVQGAETNLDQEELIAMIGFLLFAGHETTVSLIGSAMWLLLHSQQWALLRAQPGLIPAAVEEVLRYESPEQRTSFRLVETPLTINGYTLEPGQQIGVIIGSANRDELVFERADEFVIQRNPNRHLAFGIGTHNCLGKTLARVEAQVALEVLLDLMPAPALLDAVPQWRKNSFFRGLQSLRLTPGKQ